MVRPEPSTELMDLGGKDSGLWGLVVLFIREGRGIFFPTLSFL